MITASDEKAAVKKLQLFIKSSRKFQKMNKIHPRNKKEMENLKVRVQTRQKLFTEKHSWVVKLDPQHGLVI